MADAGKPKRVFKLAGKLREATAVEKAAVKPQAEEQTDLLKSPEVVEKEPAAAAAQPPPAPTKLKSIFAARKPTAAVAAGAEAPPFAPPLPLPPAKKAAAAAAAGAEAVARAGPVVRIIGKKTIFPTTYGDELEPYVAGIFEQEDSNPYVATDDATVYPVPTRRGFQEKILQTYEEFIQVDEGKPIDFEACRAMGAAGEQKVQIYLYQQFVREYMRQLTPYRGLLVYHGLGSGKTCSAIAAAQALFSTTRKKIIVMTPFSLRENFIKEVTFCGFRHYRLQNFWAKLDARDATVKLFASQILGLPEPYLKKNLDIWVPDFEQEAPNFDRLTASDRDQIRKQLATQIQTRITFINYNGITASRLKEMACQAGDKGFFDDAVIVVDEVHNLTRLMQGTIEPYLLQLPGVRRRIAPEPVVPGRWKPSLCASPRNYKRGYLLYRMLTSAKNAKIIGLSGTPLINFPEELGILMNLLHGYIELCKITLTPASEKVRVEAESLLHENAFIDFVQANLTTTGVDIMFSLLPEGTRKVIGADGKMQGVQKIAPNAEGVVVAPSIQDIAEQVVAMFQTRGYKTNLPSFVSEPLLPPIGMQFRDTFIMEDGISIKNELVLRKRLQGLISYYRGSKKELMPMIKRDEVVRVPMSKYQQAEYMRVRSEEVRRDLEKSKSKGPPTIQGYTGRVGALWAEIYDIAAMKNSNSYRMSSRQAMNFAFPEKITRPRAQNQAEVTEETGKDVPVLLDGAGDDGSGGLEGEEVLAEGAGGAEGFAEEDDERRAAEEDEAIDREERAAPAEEEGEEEEEEGTDELPVAPPPAPGEGEGEEGAAPATAAKPKPAGVAPPPPPPPGGPPARPRPAAARPGVPAAPPGAPAAGAATGRVTLKQLEAQRAAFAEECKRGLIPGEKYAVALKRAKQCLLNFARRKLMLNPPPLPGAPVGEAPDSLEKYSSKYAAILRSILAAPGSSLVYSQFLDMEGIGIFSICLEVNGFTPIEIQSNGAGGWTFSEKTRASLAKPAQNRYVVFTGAEKREVRSLALKLFNARFTELPEELQSFTYTLPNKTESPPITLASLFPNGNKTGDLSRVFCITSAGAEGLSLRNVRQVHIMEPYWNSVRTDQVKGRAVRICSHVDLDYNEDPELNQRTVEVFTYCSIFPTEAQTAPLESKLIDQTIIGSDSITKTEAEQVGIPYPAGAKQYTLTSDEYLYMLSERKRKLLSTIQDLMKGVAVDCQLNEFENRDDGLKCLAMPAGSQGDFAYHPALADDIAYTMQVFREGAAAGEGAGAKLKPAAAKPAAAQALVPAAISAGLAAAPVRGVSTFAAAAERERAAAAAGAAPSAVKTIKILRLKINGAVYQAVGRGEDPSKPLTYDLYGEFDKSRLKRLGYLMADITTGKPTTDITLF